MRGHRHHEGTRIARVFALLGCVLWLAAAGLVVRGFAPVSADYAWVDMHHDKLLVGLGVGFAGIGTLFICFSALIAVLSRTNQSI